MTPTLRQRLVQSAVDLTLASGWSQVTMARLAAEVGVSRQTVYNEIGGKPALAEAMILGELDRFLSVVTDAFDRHPDDLVAAIENACVSVLELAQGNELLKAVVSATHGADTELLPLLTTHAESLLAAAKQVVGERVAAYDVPLDVHHREAAIDMVVRVVLSHVMQPSASPPETAADLAWVASRVLPDAG
ncbi:TetR/AcrR family transcriptional regulator [Nocardioides coralli]|uniref:TetR/AcrR family transcriptional regulator n=1 Tax=Nocardioides coralli TaxID=2872154 RepID=UPI001CA3CB92|nr:TetR family transcriptional regulator [Nocardioides coralli]QZY29216.1 TetR family transcriptional regulator [Nocardioides coralli]